MLNCKAEDRQVDGLFINSLIVLLFLLLLCFCGSFCHLPCRKRRTINELINKPSTCLSLLKENKTRLNSECLSALARFRLPKQRVGILENQGIPPSCLGNKSSAPLCAG